MADELGHIRQMLEGAEHRLGQAEQLLSRQPKNVHLQQRYREAQAEVAVLEAALQRERAAD